MQPATAATSCNVANCAICRPDPVLPVESAPRWNDWYLKNRRWIHPALAAMLVPVLVVLTDSSYLDKLIEFFNPKFPHVLEPLVTAPFIGLIGYVLYKLDPNAAKNAHIIKPQ